MNWMKQKIEESQLYQNEAFSNINELIITKRDKNKHITIESGQLLTDFISCSYLGLDVKVTT